MDILAWKRTDDGVAFMPVDENFDIRSLAMKGVEIRISWNDCAMKGFISEMLEEPALYICTGRDGIDKDICETCPYRALTNS